MLFIYFLYILDKYLLKYNIIIVMVMIFKKINYFIKNTHNKYLFKMLSLFSVQKHILHLMINQSGMNSLVYQISNISQDFQFACQEPNIFHHGHLSICTFVTSLSPDNSQNVIVISILSCQIFFYALRVFFSMPD